MISPSSHVSYSTSPEDIKKLLQTDSRNLVLVAVIIEFIVLHKNTANPVAR